MASEYIISDQDKLDCLKRELKMRERVYPRWVSTGKMTQALADKETRTMRALVAEFEARVEGTRLI